MEKKRKDVINLWQISEDGCPSDPRDEVVHPKLTESHYCSSDCISPLGRIMTWLGLQMSSYSAMDYAPTQADWGAFKLQLEEPKCLPPPPSLSSVQALFWVRNAAKKKKKATVN